MQRLGFLKYVVASASPQRPQTGASIGRALLNTVSRKHETIIRPEMKEYFDRVFSEQHYSDFRSRLKKAIEQQPSVQVDLELQDIYLSQDILPSKRGRILSEKEKDLHVFPTLAVSLGFLSPDDSVLTSRGRLFANSVSSSENDSFSRVSDVNPLIITHEQTMILLFSFLQADSDLISLLYPIIIKKEGLFTDYEIGNHIGDLLESYLSKAEKSASSMQDKTDIAKLKKTNAKIKAWKNKEYSGVGARDEWATIRLEPYVDMGLFKKPDKFSFKYELTNGGRKFLYYFETNNNVESFLYNNYISAAAQLFGIETSAVFNSDEALDYLKQSNRLLSNNIGYSDLIDTALLSAIKLLLERKRVLEIEKAINILREAQKNAPRDIHFNIDRWGKVKFISFRKT